MLERLEERRLLAATIYITGSTTNDINSSDPARFLDDGPTPLIAAPAQFGPDVWLAANLRSAIAAHNSFSGETTIYLEHGGVSSYELDGHPLEVTWPGGAGATSLRIASRTPGALAVINGTSQFAVTQIFDIDAGGTTTFDHLKLTGGNSLEAGAVDNDGTLIVRSSVFDNNRSASAMAGAILNTGTLNLFASTFSNNRVDSPTTFGFGGAIISSGTLTAVNCTFYQNSVSASVQGVGGAIYNEGNASIDNCTFSGNDADLGAGIFTVDQLTMDNTIVANSVGGGADVFFAGGTMIGANNLIEDGSGGGAGLTGTITGDPNLGGLTNNGGPTDTMALLALSPAIDAGNSALLPAGTLTDQRGSARVSNGQVDIGAFEVYNPNVRELAADLQAQIADLKDDGVLNKGQSNSLIVKLDLKGNAGDIGKLQALLNHINGLEKAGVLSAAQADSLRDGASAILLLLTAP